MGMREETHRHTHLLGPPGAASFFLSPNALPTLMGVARVSPFRRACRRPLQYHPQHRQRAVLQRTKVALHPSTSGISDATLVKVLLVWSVCSDVTESGARGLPQASASPPPSGQGQAKWYSAAS